MAVSPENTLGYLEGLVHAENPTYTLVAVQLRVGNHNGADAVDREAYYRYFVVHAPRTEARDPNEFHQSPVSVALPPVGAERVRRVAMLKACILTDKGFPVLPEETIMERIRHSLAAAESLHPYLDPYLVFLEHEWKKMRGYLRAAKGVLAGRGPDVVATVLSDMPLLWGGAADDAHFSVYMTDANPLTGGLETGRLLNLHGTSQPVEELDILQFAIADWQERDRISALISEQLGPTWFANFK